MSPVATAENSRCRILPLGNNHKLLDHILNTVRVHVQQLFVIYFRSEDNACNAVQLMDFYSSASALKRAVSLLARLGT